MVTSREGILAQQIADAVNTLSFDSKVFCETIGSEHKTLQQSFMRDVVIPFIEYAASDDYSVDGRNEATHKLAAELKSTLEKSSIVLSFI